MYEPVETQGCFTEADAEELKFLAYELKCRAEALRNAWQQDQRKQKWREHVRWCHDELCVTLAHIREVQDND